MLVSDVNGFQLLVPVLDVTLTPKDANLKKAGKRHFTSISTKHMICTLENVINL